MIFASNNLDKVKEIENILGEKVLSLKDIKEKIEIDENKDTFLENAILKALFSSFVIDEILVSSGLIPSSIGIVFHKKGSTILSVINQHTRITEKVDDILKK